MTPSSRPQLQQNPNSFEELIRFLANRKKWYLIPAATVILLLALLIALGGTSAAPFIYTLF